MTTKKTGGAKRKQARKSTAAEQPPSTIATIEAAAAALGVNDRTLKRWFAQGCPKAPGRYDVKAIAAWRDATLKARKEQNPKRAKWEARKVRADALTRELVYQRKRGELIDVATAAQIIKQHIAEVVTHLDQLPDFAVAGHRLDPALKAKIRAKLKTKIHDMRSTLERSTRAVARRAQHESIDQAAENEIAPEN